MKLLKHLLISNISKSLYEYSVHYHFAKSGKKDFPLSFCSTIVISAFIFYHIIRT